jgi:hypothetical protein
VSEDLVVVRTYIDEMSADLACMVLEANGVPARVLRDTAGGALPALAVVFPVRLVVRAEDEDLARELLDSLPDQAPVEEDDPDDQNG